MRRVGDVLQQVHRIFLDTAPVIYYVEQHPHYKAVTDVLFHSIDQGLTTVVSPITLAECLVIPYRLGLHEIEQHFIDLILSGSNMLFVSIGPQQAQHAAQLRATYNLTLTDALQVAIALSSGCDAIVTNDVTFKRVTELQVLILNELEL